MHGGEYRERKLVVDDRHKLLHPRLIVRPLADHLVRVHQTAEHVHVGGVQAEAVAEALYGLDKKPQILGHTGKIRICIGGRCNLYAAEKGGACALCRVIYHQEQVSS